MDMTDAILILFFSFMCSAGFGVVFGICLKEIPIAGVVGTVTRLVLLTAQACTDNRLIYTLIAALAAAFSAQILSRVWGVTTTKFFYPAIVPVIPGDLMYNLVVALVMSAPECGTYASQLVQALLGLTLGAIIMPVFFHSKGYIKELGEAKI